MELQRIPSYTDFLVDWLTYEYYVTAVYDLGESDSSNHHIIDVIENILENKLNKIIFYPNPAADKVNINSEFTIKSVKVYSFTGKEVLSEIVNKTDFSLNTSGFDPGLYLFQLDTAEGRVLKRIVINK